MRPYQAFGLGHLSRAGTFLAATGEDEIEKPRPAAPAPARAQVPPVIVPLEGALDGAFRKLALCDLPTGSRLVEEGAAAVTLHVVLAGKLAVAFPGLPPLPIQPGAVLLLPANKGVTFSRQPLGRGTARLLIGAVSGFAAQALGLEKLAEPVLTRLDGDGLSDDLAAASARYTPGETMRASALMKLCLVEASRSMAAAHPQVQSRVGEAVAAILAQPGAPHSIASLANGVGMSRATFIRHFAKLTGANPMAFVAQSRLDHATEMLRTTALPVKLVAARSGFADRSHFSRAFRRAHGCDPSQFRRGLADHLSASAYQNPLSGGQED